jgi:uridylate kinase
MNQKVVIKIGGSLLFTRNNKINSNWIKKLCDIIITNQNFDSVIIICGGGVIARDYINTVRDFSKNETLCDLIGIDVSRLNSYLLISYFDQQAYPMVPKTFEDLAIAMLTHKIVIMGGIQPGQSTTSVAIEIAEYIKADNLIILTDVKGIYDKDPKINKDAKLLSKVTLKQLNDIIINKSNETQAAAGEYRIFDAVSLQILKRSKIPIYVISGIKVEEFQKLINGSKEYNGTLITD